MRLFLKCRFYRSKTTAFLGNNVRKLHKTCTWLQSTDVELTWQRYPHLKRGQYDSVTMTDIVAFSSIVSGRIITEDNELNAYNIDWLYSLKGSSQVVLSPKTTEELSAIMKYCNGRCLAVVPQGGNTGLVGGSVPVFDEVIISTRLMDNVIRLDESSGVLSCQAGCVLSTLNDYVARHDLTMPIDLGSKGSCHIGGNLATNAGGLRMLRYGSLHANILGLEVVLPDGEILDYMSEMRKDNTGYNLKHLFIGSEGTLGVITKLAILCHQRPTSCCVAFLGCQSFKLVIEVLKEARRLLGEVLTAFEFLDDASMEVVETNIGLKNPICESPFYVVIEAGGSNHLHDEEKLSVLVEHLLESCRVDCGTMATESSKIQALWSIRERLSEAMLCDGHNYKYDVSLPLGRLYDLVTDVRQRVSHVSTRVIGYGHVGDGNLHLNISSAQYSREIVRLLEPYVYDWVRQVSGSISAEHGLGLMKCDFIYHCKSGRSVRMMRQIKRLLDPNSIMNPYKVLPTN